MAEPQVVTIFIGGVFASRTGEVVKTLLGSCIAACLWDPIAHVGGMNHFMLPSGSNGDQGGLTRFGVHAMELLIGEVQKRGGDRFRLQAKVFGGGHVLQGVDAANSVPAENIRFIKRFLLAENIPIVAEDLGGRLARQVFFYTDTGKAKVKRLPTTQVVQVAVERDHQREAQQALQRTGEITLFED